MADMFKCDKCGLLGPITLKRGQLTLQEIRDGQVHVSYYNRKAEVCEKCFNVLKDAMKASPSTPLLVR